MAAAGPITNGKGAETKRRGDAGAWDRPSRNGDDKPEHGRPFLMELSRRRRGS